MLQTLKERLVECEHPVGQKKTSNWKLPQKDFAYGKPPHFDKEGVGIITRSWKEHTSSSQNLAPQDFVRINKLAVKMNATNNFTNRDFRKSVNITKRVAKGTNQRVIYLPPPEFTYGKRNRTPTPVKEVINNDYGNKAEGVIKQEYDAFMTHKTKVQDMFKQPRSTKHFEKLKEKTRKSDNDSSKQLYKMKMFSGAESKVNAGLKNFKTYEQKFFKNSGSIDNLISKVENELQQL